MEDFFTSSEMKEGFTTLSEVEKLISLMKKVDDSLSEYENKAARRWMAVANIIKSTVKRDCLDHFIRLDGLCLINQWLQEAQKSHDTEAISALLEALQKFATTDEIWFASGIDETIKLLLDHAQSSVQEKAKIFVEYWKEIRDRDQNQMDAAKAGTKTKTSSSGECPNSQCVDVETVDELELKSLDCTKVMDLETCMSESCACSDFNKDNAISKVSPSTVSSIKQNTVPIPNLVHDMDDSCLEKESSSGHLSREKKTLEDQLASEMYKDKSFGVVRSIPVDRLHPHTSSTIGRTPEKSKVPVSFGEVDESLNNIEDIRGMPLNDSKAESQEHGNYDDINQRPDNKFCEGADGPKEKDMECGTMLQNFLDKKEREFHGVRDGFQAEAEGHEQETESSLLTELGEFSDGTNKNPHGFDLNEDPYIVEPWNQRPDISKPLHVSATSKSLPGSLSPPFGLEEGQKLKVSAATNAFQPTSSNNRSLRLAFDIDLNVSNGDVDTIMDHFYWNSKKVSKLNFDEFDLNIPSYTSSYRYTCLKDTTIEAQFCQNRNIYHSPSRSSFTLNQFSKNIDLNDRPFCDTGGSSSPVKPSDEEENAYELTSPALLIKVHCPTESSIEEHVYELTAPAFLPKKDLSSSLTYYGPDISYAIECRGTTETSRITNIPSSSPPLLQTVVASNFYPTRSHSSTLDLNIDVFSDENVSGEPSSLRPELLSLYPKFAERELKSTSQSTDLSLWTKRKEPDSDWESYSSPGGIKRPSFLERLSV